MVTWYKLDTSRTVLVHHSPSGTFSPKTRITFENLASAKKTQIVNEREAKTSLKPNKINDVGNLETHIGTVSFLVRVVSIRRNKLR